MASSKYYVEPIHYRSQCITFPEWVSLFTLCLAPLIAHIASGTPPISYLAHSRPRWYDYLCHYNPTSIIWRYAAITDRRIRATHWSRNDLAASNAIFWTTKGWNGSEDMVLTAAPHCSRCPELTHVKIISVTMLKTMITMLQGISALYLLIASLAYLKNIQALAVDQIFYPLAVLGLLRLCAAIWLTEDFEYSPQNVGSNMKFPQGLQSSINNDHNIQLTESRDVIDPFLVTLFSLAHGSNRPALPGPAASFALSISLALGSFWGLSFVNITPFVASLHFTTTSFLAVLFYFFLLTVSIILYVFYFFHNQTTTTLLPCISKTWYKVYTLLVMSFMFVMIVVASIETNRMPNGSYVTSQAPIELQCSSLKRLWAFLPNKTFLGFRSRIERNSTELGQNYSGVPVAVVSGNDSSFGERYWMYNFTGYCIGQF